jgi:hypothetical protein
MFSKDIFVVDKYKTVIGATILMGQKEKKQH